MIINSAFDVVDFEIAPRWKPVLAWLCAERAAGVWRTSGGRTGELVQEALAAMEYLHRASSDRASVVDLRGAHQAILEELNPDSDFGPLHQFKVHAASSVAHASAAILDEDEQEAVQESTQAALAEVSMVKGAYYRINGSYAGVYDHRPFIRQIDWQLNDMRDLGSDMAVPIGSLLLQAKQNGLRLAEDILRGQLI